MTAKTRANLKVNPATSSTFADTQILPAEQFIHLADSMEIAAGGADVSAARLKAWTEAGAYELTSITYDSDGVVSSATAKWPDGSSGTFTRTTKNTTWLAVDAYTITHALSSQTVTQTAVTRDSNGNVTAKPALTIS